MTRAEELAKEHENWMLSLLETLPSFRDLPPWAKQFTMKLYADAIIHGFRHGWEEGEKPRMMTRELAE